MISLLQHLILRGCSTSAKPTCPCAEAYKQVTYHIDAIGVLEELIDISESTPKWRLFGDREAIDWLDMCDSKSREFVQK